VLRGLETRWLTGRDRDRNQHPTQGPPEFQGVPGQEFVKSLQDLIRNPPDTLLWGSFNLLETSVHRNVETVRLEWHDNGSAEAAAKAYIKDLRV